MEFIEESSLSSRPNLKGSISTAGALIAFEFNHALHLREQISPLLEPQLSICESLKSDKR